MSRRNSVLYAPQPEGLILPDGPITEPAAELLTDLVHHPGLITSDGHNEISTHGTLPWYKTASPLWLLVLLPFAATAASSTFAPRIEVYTQLVCAVHKPDIFEQRLFSTTTAPNRCASDPTVQAEVAKLTSGKYRFSHPSMRSHNPQ